MEQVKTKRGLAHKLLCVFVAFTLAFGMIPMAPNVGWAAESEPEVTSDAQGGGEQTDSAVAEVQAMIDALVIPNTDDYDSAEAYEVALAELEKQLGTIDEVAASLTEQQDESLDGAKYGEAWTIINEYWLSKMPAMADMTDGWYWDGSTLYVLDGKIQEKNLYAAILTKCTSASGIKYATSKPSLGWGVGGDQLSSTSTSEIDVSGSYAAGCKTGRIWSTATDVFFDVVAYYNLTINLSDATLSNSIPLQSNTVTVTVPHVEGKEPSVAYNGGNVALTQDGNVWTGTLTAVASGEVTVTYNDANTAKYVVNVEVIGDGDAFADFTEAIAGTHITITATPAVSGTTSVDNYLQSITVNGTAIVGNSFTLGEEEANVVVAFGKVSLGAKEVADPIYFNMGLNDWDVSNLKSQVLTAVLESEYNANEYSVEMEITLFGYTTYADVTGEYTSYIASGLMKAGLGSFKVTRVVDGRTVYDTFNLTVKDSRATASVQAAKESVTFSGKTEADALAAYNEVNGTSYKSIQDAVDALFVITAEDPQTGSKDVGADDISKSWIADYDWPADGDTSELTYRVSVSGSDYVGTASASVAVTLIDTTVLYTVSYVDGQGNTLLSERVAEGAATPKLEADPTREYYTFAGWTPEVPANVPAGVEGVENVLEYTATWNANTDANGNGIADETEKYTVVFDYNEGVATDSNAVNTFENLAYGADTPTAPEVMREGYNFAGWSPEVATKVSAPASSNTITYTAQWTQKYVVTFRNEAADPVETTVEVENGGFVAAPETPVWDEDHDFLGWYAEGDTDTFDFENTAIDKNIALTAKWREDFNHNDIDDSIEAHYTITYMDGETTLETFENILVNLETPTIANPEKTGSKFIGWQPEVAEFVTADATYVAKWVDDTNSNGVDDALETITVNVIGEGSVVKVNDTDITDNPGSFVYDSTKGNALTIYAAPKTTASLFSSSIITSETYVELITVGENELALTYGNLYTATASFDAEGGQTVTVKFAAADFVYNEDRLLNFYPGMEGVVLDDVYNTIVKNPALPGDYTLQYFARPAMTQTVNLASLGLPDILLNLLKVAGYDTLKFDLPELWLDVEVNDLSDEIENAISLEAACQKYLSAEAIEAAWNESGLPGVLTLIRTATTEIPKAAMYYGAHSFGYNATPENTVTEKIKVTYGNDAMYIEGETDITLKDMRESSQITGNNISVMYKDYTDEELASLIGVAVTDMNGLAIEGAIATSIDITDPYTFEGKNVSETAYDLKFKFAGNETYKPSEATFTVTVTKAPAEFNIPDVNVEYGTGYTMLDSNCVTLGNKYGDVTELTDSAIQFVVGLDVAELDVDKDGVTGLNGKVQLILPAELQSMLDSLLGLTGGNTSDGMEMTLSELTEYLQYIDDSSLGVLKQALEAIQGITEAGDITVQIGGALPTNIGAYLYGAVSTSSNYETAYDVATIIIKPAATQVYMDWNYTDTNGVFSYELLEHVNLGASAYDDEAFATLNSEATALVNNVIFGIEPAVDENGEPTAKVVAALYAADEITDPEAIEADLNAGAYTQLAFIAEFGNEMYYAVPIARAFVLVPNMVDVEIGDSADTNVVAFEANKAQELPVTLTYEGELLTVDESLLQVSYTGIRSNLQVYETTEVAPTHAGAYVVTAVYVHKDDAGNVLALGVDVEPLIINPAEATIDVTGGQVDYDGEAHGVTVDKGGVNYDHTLISGTVDLDVNLEDGVTLADVAGTVNVDVPAWLDEILKAEFPDAYANGVDKAKFVEELNEYKQLLLDAGVSEESLAELINLLNQVPADVMIKVSDDPQTYTNPGAYAYVGIITDSDYMPAYDTGLLVIQGHEVDVEIGDAETDTNEFTYNGSAQAPEVEVKATDGSNYVVDKQKLTVVYTGVQTNMQSYNSTEAPTNAGAYVATALYVDKNEAGEVIALGGDVESLIIKPAESTISVAGGSYEYTGEARGVEVNASSADITMISGTVDYAASVDGVSLADVTGIVNVDVPAWLDEILAEEFPDAYANGINKTKFVEELNEYMQVMIDAGVSQDAINGLIDLLNQIPSDVMIKVGDNNQTYTEPGAYAYLGIVTDSNYIPSYDTGLVTIGKKTLVLDMVDTTVTYTGEEQWIDVIAKDGEGNTVEGVDYLTLIVDRENNVANLVLDDDAKAILALIEKVLGTELPSEIDVDVLIAKIDETKLELDKIENLPEDWDILLEQLREAITTSQISGTIKIDGELPTDAGEYEFYAISYSVDYKPQATQGVLTIEKAENEWTTEPAIADWTIGETPAQPVGEAKFGDVVFKFFSDEACENEVAFEEIGVGTYYMTASVEGTENYSGLESDVIKFTVKSDSTLDDILNEMGIQTHSGSYKVDETTGETFAYVRGFDYSTNIPVGLKYADKAQTVKSFIDELKAKVALVDPNAVIEFTASDGSSVADDVTVATGMKFTVTVNGVKHVRVTVLMGDVDGDGGIWATDFRLIKNDIMKDSNTSGAAECFAGAYALAADLDDDGTVYPTDYMIIKNHIMGGDEGYEDIAIVQTNPKSATWGLA